MLFYIDNAPDRLYGEILAINEQLWDAAMICLVFGAKNFRDMFCISKTYNILMKNSVIGDL